MLVHGDRPREVAPAEVLEHLRVRLRHLATVPEGLERHAALVTLLIESGVIAQGLLDADAEAAGHDELGPRGQAWLALPMAFARALRESLEGGWRGATVPESVVAPLERLELPARITLKEPEGYTHFALYPELYLEAARASRLAGSVRVVGLRSIGTGLACGVAAGLGVSTPPLTVRPVGPPFERRLSLGPRLTRELEDAARGGAVAIVDEGPGLSGSSFGAVADFLEDRGMPLERLHFFPSHAGNPGPMASERHRTRWTRAHRHCADFDACLVHPEGRPAPLATWVEDLTGPATGPLVDVSAGAWRHHHFPDVCDWPAVHVQQERRKYLLTTERGTFLLRFAGLGAQAEHRATRAHQLAEAGFTPPIEGLRHGFLVQRWLSEARPLSQVREVDRAALLAQVGRYLGFRARAFPARGSGRGAPLIRLLEMARYNTAGALDAWVPPLSALSREVHPVETDNKLHAWEWLVLPDGRLLKTDAVDHHDGLDLVGCQDIAWDVVGATVELDLNEAEQQHLIRHIEHASGRAVLPLLRRFYRPCYLAFQLGHHALAATALEHAAPDEAARLRAAAARYAAHLRAYVA